MVRRLYYALVLTGCGDALVERGYRGEPLYTFTGQIAAASGGAFEHPVRAAVFWSPGRGTRIDERLVEQPSLAVAVHFPGTFEINVFEPPMAVDWSTPDDDWRLGLVLIYEDLDEDGRFSPDELRGGARDQALLYLERPLSATESPTGTPLDAGFHAVRLPMLCGHEEEEHDRDQGTRAAECGVPIGEGCATDADCGTGGACLTRDRTAVWTGGYCVQLFVEGGCEPRGGRLVGDAWHRGCDDDDDCRLADGYRCEEDVCVPGAPVALVVDPSFVLAPLCVLDDD